MDYLQIKNTWNEKKGKLKLKYWKLTDDDLVYQEGRQDELIERLQKKLKMSKAAIREIIREA